MYFHNIDEQRAYLVQILVENGVSIYSGMVKPNVFGIGNIWESEKMTSLQDSKSTLC